MKLNIQVNKPNTQTVQFRIDPDTNQMLTKLRKHYGVSNGILIKEMIKQSYAEIYNENGNVKYEHRG
mgnify:CR=1 FL=1